MIITDTLITIEQAAAALGVTPRAVRFHCKAGKVTGAFKIAGVWLMPRHSIEAIRGLKPGRHPRKA